MTIEYKEFEVKVSDVKMDGDMGTAVILLSPYNNIDLGYDRVMPSIATRNSGKKIPLLKQHQVGTEHGHMDLFSTSDGINANVTLYLEKNEGSIIFPEAFQHYALLKRAETDGVPVKYSIGYNTLDYKYVTEGKQTIRDLNDIDIMEGSRVTFPMNPMAQNVRGSVKSLEGGEKLEFKIGAKAIMLNDALEMGDLEQLRWQIQSALNESMASIMNDCDTNNVQKIALIDTTLTQYHQAMLDLCTKIINATEQMQKQLDATELVEKASSIFMREIKAGAAISKPNAERLQGIMKAVSEVMGCNWDKIQKAMIDDTTDDGEPQDDAGGKSDDEDLEFKTLYEGFLDYAKNIKKDEV
ncbi:hypothetical protein GH810_14425 [Acetobacterium paludosum]|uniref:Prohead serine protease domain-containing protein n=1 Tax=Acetobacterium paludosum TaxID=52693 RepID=A0A923KYC7_9FIRM|nr:hypothetical protein [Acetobacterium paludosum]MBC3889506.1 hypothetical protein [Acetobacterium paludosum]